MKNVEYRTGSGNEDMHDAKIKSFTDLQTWQEAHKFVLLLYATTKDFPKEEMFGLTSQMRRVAVSITSNIAEGFSRFSYKEKIQFYRMGLSSLTEAQNQLRIAKDINYIKPEKFTLLEEISITVQKLLTGLIRKSKEF